MSSERQWRRWAGKVLGGVMVGMMVERLWSSKAPRVGTPFAALKRARCSRAEGELEYTRPTGTRPQTSPERSGRRGPQVHPVGRSVSTAALHLVGHHPKAKPPPSRRSHISLCSTSHNSECEPSVSAPWMSTRAMGGQGMGGVVCRSFGCGAGKRALLQSHHVASCFSATPPSWEESLHVRCLFLPRAGDCSSPYQVN